MNIKISFKFTAPSCTLCSVPRYYF